LNVHGPNKVRQTEIHTTEPLVPKPSASDVELAIEKLKSHRSPGVDQNPAELIRAGGMTIRYEIHKLIIRRNRSTTDHIICILQILEKKLEYNEVVHQFFIDSMKAYGSVRKEVYYKILIELVSHENGKANKNVSY
jgi:hypothetical protein